MASSERIFGQPPCTEGRDEMNLADFPISVLQRQQPVGADGQKLDTATFASSRYDSRLRQRQEQRVVLESNARQGLPTPADENTVLALLYVAKHAHNFSEPIVHFTPRQLFRIMGWAPNSRSYLRLRGVLRRLKALVIRYENAWWDNAGRAYEAEMATGIIAEYELGRQVAGQEKGGRRLSCWVRWSPQFQQSLSNGNLKKLDLETLFSLRLPTSQRMYRFLDKRFYQNPSLEMDLKDFACGHIGLNRVDNVAELKRRLMPAIKELEGIGFICPAEPEDRFRKVKAGVWRIRLTSGPRRSAAAVDRVISVRQTEVVVEAAQLGAPVQEGDATSLAVQYYRTWGAAAVPNIGESELARAQLILDEFGTDANCLIAHLVRVVKRKWPDCRSLSGAVEKYLPDARQALQQERRRAAARSRNQEQQQRHLGEQDRLSRQHELDQQRWDSLPEGVRQSIEAEVLNRHPEHRGRIGIMRMLCLEELAKQP